MSARKPIKALSQVEFVILMAALMAMAALSIDAMLPAFDGIAAYFDVIKGESVHHIVTYLFGGMAIGQLVFGPLSDSLGRKAVLYIGMSLFVGGALISIFTSAFDLMLLGRFIQGLGLAAPRTVAMAMTRDLYKGREMARIMSFVMMIFIIAPAVAPSIGQILLFFGSWQIIFVFLIAQGIFVTLWLGLRQPETLSSEHRAPLRIKPIWEGIKEVSSNRAVLGNLIATGLVMSNLLIYLNAAQPIFVDLYGLGAWFPLFFGALALLSSISSFLNAHFVERLGMRLLSSVAIGIWVCAALVFLIPAMRSGGVPWLPIFMVYAAIGFCMLGFIFGNLNSLAMEPMGHRAGVAASIIGCFSTIIGIVASELVWSFYDQTVFILVIANLATLPLAWLIARWGNKEKRIAANAADES